MTYMPKKIVVVGSINLDLVAYVPRMPAEGETIALNDFATYPGGKGANQAVAAARLGANVVMIGRLGQDHPNGEEQKQYVNGTSQMPNWTYGLIDYLPNLDGAGHVLIIQGLNMAATQAVADVLFYPPEMRPILKRARLPNGSLRSSELLIQTSSIGATDPGRPDHHETFLQVDNLRPPSRVGCKQVRTSVSFFSGF